MSVHFLSQCCAVSAAHLRFFLRPEVVRISRGAGCKDLAAFNILRLVRLAWTLYTTKPVTTMAKMPAAMASSSITESGTITVSTVYL